MICPSKCMQFNPLCHLTFYNKPVEFSDSRVCCTAYIHDCKKYNMGELHLQVAILSLILY